MKCGPAQLFDINTLEQYNFGYRIQSNYLFNFVKEMSIINGVLKLEDAKKSELSMRLRKAIERKVLEKQEQLR